MPCLLLQRACVYHNVNEIFVDMTRDTVSEIYYGGHLLPKVDHDTHRKEEQYWQRSSSSLLKWSELGTDCIGRLARHGPEAHAAD